MRAMSKTTLVLLFVTAFSITVVTQTGQVGAVLFKASASSPATEPRRSRAPPFSSRTDEFREWAAKAKSPCPAGRRGSI